MQIQNLYFSSGKPFIHVNKFIDFLQKNFGFNFDEQNDYFEIQNQIIENLYDLKFLMMVRINHDVFSNGEFLYSESLNSFSISLNASDGDIYDGMMNFLNSNQKKYHTNIS